LGAGDLINVSSLISPAPTAGPTFGTYTGRSPVCAPSRAGILTGGSSAAIVGQDGEGNSTDVLVAVLIAVLMLGAMAYRIL